jgi:hypothetical protein
VEKIASVLVATGFVVKASEDNSPHFGPPSRALLVVITETRLQELIRKKISAKKWNFIFYVYRNKWGENKGKRQNKNSQEQYAFGLLLQNPEANAL